MRYLQCGMCGMPMSTSKPAQILNFLCPHCHQWYEDESSCPDWGVMTYQIFDKEGVPSYYLTRRVLYLREEEDE